MFLCCLAAQCCGIIAPTTNPVRGDHLHATVTCSDSRISCETPACQCDIHSHQTTHSSTTAHSKAATSSAGWYNTRQLCISQQCGLAQCRITMFGNSMNSELRNLFIQPFLFTNKKQFMYILRHIWHFDNEPRRHLLRQKYLSLARFHLFVAVWCTFTFVRSCVVYA